ncbi:4Fe-4S dicluster domain-containing protein [Quadrisphaera sp. DSM 44207]|uniref:4Fe-4S dicluster domain-containing protein n=1 Tax=Quadrisphaera sp. DSM 44207 TaxID=1881057 RepID=UPI000B88E1A6
MGFFTDTSVCIGCKACEVACKEWNQVPATGDLDMTGWSYDNSAMLGGSTWRHVAFVEQTVPRKPVSLGMPGVRPDDGPFDASTAVELIDGPPVSAPPGEESAQGPSGSVEGVRWLMSSDVCKHCTNAACLDVCPTGALFRTEFGTVVVQDDVCNGCGYCVAACPFGVIGKRESDGQAHKCTLCYDRLGADLEPACAKACPTDSIQFGPLDELRERADARLAQLVEAGEPKAQLYGRDPDDGVGGDGAFFLLLDDPEVYGLPPDPVVTTRDLPSMWKHAGAAALTMVATVALSFATAGRRR